jgi:hypothetical protein
MIMGFNNIICLQQTPRNKQRNGASLKMMMTTISLLDLQQLAALRYLISYRTAP